MSSFKGSYQYTVDAKGRVNLPAKMRRKLSPNANDSFVITYGFEHCLFVYPEDEWDIQEQKLRDLNVYLPEPRLFLRVMLEHAVDAQLDAQSRIMIPPGHREYAGINDDVLIVGMLEKIELWNPTAYEEYKKNNLKKTYEEIAAETMGLRR